MFISNNLTFRSYFPTHPTFTSPQRWILWTPFSTRSWNMLIILTSFKVLLWQVLPQLVGILFVKRLYGFLWTTFQVNWLVLGWSCPASHCGGVQIPIKNIKFNFVHSAACLISPCLFLHLLFNIPCVAISSLQFYNSYPRGKGAKTSQILVPTKAKDFTRCIFQGPNVSYYLWWEI